MGEAAAGIGAGVSGFAQAYAADRAAKRQAEAAKYGSDVSNQIAQRNLEAEQQLTGYTTEQQKQLTDAYRQAYQQALGQYASGENKLNTMFETSPEELKTLEEQALTGQSKELQQGKSALQAGLAQAGVRGGQAATQLNRGIGEMTQNATQNIQGLIANEAINRANQQRQYTGQQQQNLQNFMLNPQSAQYSQITTPEQEAKLKELMQKYLAV